MQMSIECLRPIEELAYRYYLRPAEVKVILDEGGVATVTVRVARKRIELVNEAEACAAIARRLIPEERSPSDQAELQYIPMTDRLDAQDRELEDMRKKLLAIEAGLRMTSNN